MKIRNMLIFCMVWILAGCSPAGISTPPTETAVEPPVVDTTPLSGATTQPTHTAAPATSTTPSPTVYLSPTPIATPIQTGTKPVDAGKPGFPDFEQLFAWMPFSEDSSDYGFFDLNETGSTNWERILPVSSDAKGAGSSVSLAFSRYTHQVAYLVNNDALELWVADFNLTHPERVWVDDGWIGEIGNFTELRLMWGINDRYIILLPSVINKEQIVIYDTKTRFAEKWLGKCDIVAKSPVSENIVIWCASIDQSPTTPYLVLEKDGIIKVQQKPVIVATAIDWAYSPSGNRLLFITSDLQVYVTLQDNQILKIPATFESSSFFDVMIRQNLQWSYDEENILIYAYGEPRTLCSQWKKHKILEDRPCWLVFDPGTAMLKWNPGAKNTGLSTPWEDLTFVHGATLTKDGKWLIILMTNIAEGRDFFFYITSLDDNRTKVLTADEVIYLGWAK